MMHVNIFVVTREVAIGWYNQKIGHRKNIFCLKCELIVSCQESWIVLCYQFLYRFSIHQFLYLLLLQVRFLLSQFWCWNCCWRSFSQDVHHMMFWKNIFYCLGHLVLMKILYFLLGSEVTRFGAASQILH